MILCAGKTTVKSDDATRFIEFVNCLNSADDAHFQAAVSEYVEVDEFLRFLALEGLLANLDSPLLTGQRSSQTQSPSSRDWPGTPPLSVSSQPME